MTGTGDLNAASYARQIERLWSDLAERPVVLSPRDWARICDWHARRVPLELVREAFEEVAGRRRGGKPLRTLGGVHRAVEAAWAAILQGRSADPLGGARPEPSPVAPERCWAILMEREEAGSRLRSILKGLLDRLERGEDRGALDEELDRALLEAAPREVRDEILREIDRDIALYRSRMPPERFEASRRRGCVERLRRRLGLPRLSVPGKRG